MEYPRKNTEGLTAFGTLIRENNIINADRWKPISVSQFETFVSQGSLCNMPRELKKNIVYSLQYIQYIELQLQELNLHSIITTMLYKNYIITGVSIIEGIFYHLLKSTGNWRQKEWELVQTVKTNTYQSQGDSFKIENQIYKKIDPKDDEMNLDSMIKKIESKNLIDIQHKGFPYIKRLKRLRNRVHLQINEHPNDTDWNTFKEIDYLWMKYTLHKILTNSKFQNDANIISFLKVTKEELNILLADQRQDEQNE